MAARRSHGDGSIFYEESRKRWVGSCDLPPDGTGKRRRAKVSGQTKTAVKVKLDELRRQVADGLPVADGSLTFGQLLDRWLEEVLPARTRVKSSNTRENYRWAAGHLRPALGSVRLRALTPEHVEGLLTLSAATSWPAMSPNSPRCRPVRGQWARAAA